ncbi:MAG: transglycosylase domain-containing protein [Mogibacterium sp.]|nr:transglycosylase domain-containing protein [Mogibacterium sp.]
MFNDFDKRKTDLDEIDAFLARFDEDDDDAPATQAAPPSRSIKTDSPKPADKSVPAAKPAAVKTAGAKAVGTKAAAKPTGKTASKAAASKSVTKSGAKAGTKSGTKATAKSGTKSGARKTSSKNYSYQSRKYKKPGLLKRLFFRGNHFSILKFLRNLIVIGLIFFIACCAYAYRIISRADKIDPTTIYDNIAENSIVYDDEGNEIEEIYYTQNRGIITYEEMPPDLINAFVAIEDKTFWTHHGFNWIRMFGALVESLLGHGEISGTSTITQQLARNVFLPERKSERSIERKIIEMYYAYEIEKTLTKEQIIEAYLNSVYFGFGSYGVQAAADSYFSKAPKDLTLLECAALAALPQLPETYALVKYAGADGVSEGDTNIIIRKPDTYVANDSSADRRDLCLDLMLEQGYITQEQHDEAYEISVMEFINPHISTGSSKYSYFTDHLLDQVEHDLMEKYDLTEDEAERMVYAGGLHIYSTLDTTAQDVIMKEFKDDDNYPSLSGIQYDEYDNIVANDGSVMLYRYENLFNKNEQFVFGKKDVTINDDGSITVKRGKKLNIYTTEVAGNVDYSLEFKPIYVFEDSILYIYEGGYINIPAEYKSLDSKNNLVISAQYFEDYPDHIIIENDRVKIDSVAYSLPQKQIQPQSACAIVQVGTGEVKALVGGRGATGRRLYNRALNPRQPGSSIKPLSVYGAALQKSYEYAEAGQKFPYVDYGHDKQGAKYYGDYLTAASCVIDEKMTFDGKTWPYNVDNTFRGPVTMRAGMRNSLNTVAVKIELQLGDQYCADMLRKFGLTTIETEDPVVNDLNPAALALGGLTHGAIPLEMAQAYATYPNGGIRQSSIAYTTVTDREGNVILTAESKQTRVVDEGVAWIMTDMLKYVVSSGYAYAADIDGVQAGGKSGTTNSNYDIWFDGITPNYACVVWIGTDVNIPLSSMSIMSVQLWGKIMNQIPKAKIGKYKSMPDNVVKKNGEYFTSGTEKGLSTYIEDERKKKEAEEAKRKADADKAAAEKVVEKINKADANNEKSVTDARKAYEKLTDDQKKYVSDSALDRLKKLEAKVKKNKEKQEPEKPKPENGG